MLWSRKKPTVDQDTIDWMLECWVWLDRIFLPVDAEPKRSFISPSRTNFPDTLLTGHEKAEYYFDLVKHFSGMNEWPVALRAQAAQPNLGDSIVFAEQSSSHVLGSFRTKGNAAIITYDPGQLENTIQLVATFAHELAHYALLNAIDDPPGGSELEEFATDLATVHMGFGLFGANSAFHYKQTTDFDRQGWVASRSGYLGENGWCFACALFVEILDIPPESYAAHTKRNVATQIEKNRKFLAANPSIVKARKSPCRN